MFAANYFYEKVLKIAIPDRSPGQVRRWWFLTMINMILDLP
jgi:hypothetical protein